MHQVLMQSSTVSALTLFLSTRSVDQIPTQDLLLLLLFLVVGENFSKTRPRSVRAGPKMSGPGQKMFGPGRNFRAGPKKARAVQKMFRSARKCPGRPENVQPSPEKCYFLKLFMISAINFRQTQSKCACDVVYLYVANLKSVSMPQAISAIQIMNSFLQFRPKFLIFAPKF